MKLLQLFTFKEKKKKEKDLMDHLVYFFHFITKEIGPDSRTDLF